jgi:hypothetical protein
VVRQRGAIVQGRLRKDSQALAAGPHDAGRRFLFVGGRDSAKPQAVKRGFVERRRDDASDCGALGAKGGFWFAMEPPPLPSPGVPGEGVSEVLALGCVWGKRGSESGDGG